MKKYLSVFFVTVIILSLGLTGCSKEEQDDNTVKNSMEETLKDTIIIGVAAEATTLDPQSSYQSNSLNICYSIFDTLVTADESYTIVPSLAEKWDVSNDGKEYTFYLNRGVKFHNGEEMTSEDVAFTFERGMQSPYVREVFELVEKVEIIDPYTIKVMLKDDNVAMLHNFSSPQMGIVSQKVVNAAGDSFKTNPTGAGTGPYKFSTWETGVQITLQANEDYFKGAPSIKTVTFKTIPDSSTGCIAVETGEIDMYLNPSGADIKKYASSERVKLYEVSSTTVYLLGFNLKKSPLDNNLVRQAINLVIDRKAIVDMAYEGAGEPAISFVHPLSFGYNTSLKEGEVNVAKAKELMADAGFPNGFSTRISTFSYGGFKRIAEIIQANLSSIGIQAKVESVDPATLMQQYGGGDTDIFVSAIGTFGLDADLHLHHSFVTNNVGNFYFYSNQKFDQIMEKAAEEFDSDKREKMYFEAQEILSKDLPAIPLLNPRLVVIANKDIKGFVLPPLGWTDVYSISW